MRGRGGSRARRSARLLGIVLVLATARTGAPTASEAPTFVVPILPSEACLSAPDGPCLAAALDIAIAAYERREFRDRVASRHLFRAVIRGVDEPAIDALLVRHDAAQAARLGPLHEEGRRERQRRRASADAEAQVAPAIADVAAERARILALRDPGTRASQAGHAVAALIRTGRAADAEALFAAAMATLPRRAPELAPGLALRTARAFAAAGNWPAWSSALLAGGYDRKVAAAKTDGPPENDPTDLVFDEPLGQGLPAEALLPWLARARDPAFRAALTRRALERQFDRGRMAAWTGDFPGFRRHVIAKTAGGELLRRDPDNAFDGGDEALLGFARNEARRRADVGLGLAVALQGSLKRLPETSAFERDTVRDRIMDAYATALVELASDR